MKIAVACDGLETALHALYCESFMVYTVSKGIVVGCQNLPNPQVDAIELAHLLHDLGVQVFISHGVEADIAKQLCYADIEVVSGVEGSPKAVVDSYLSSTLIGVDEMCHPQASSDALEEQFA